MKFTQPTKDKLIKLALLSTFLQSPLQVMDDIKESVRLAAGKAAGSLSRASVKMCDADTAGQKGGGR